MNHIYNTYTPLIEYNTTEEYRSHVRTIFKMDCESKRKEIQEIYGQGSSEAMNPTTNAIGDRMLLRLFLFISSVFVHVYREPRIL